MILIVHFITTKPFNLTKKMSQEFKHNFLEEFSYKAVKQKL